MPMTREQAIELARKTALNYTQRAAYNYLPTNEVEAANWMPHGWVVEAIMAAADAESAAVVETRIEFGFFQAEQLHGMFGGDTDCRVTVRVDAEGNMHAWESDQPAEGSVELVEDIGDESGAHHTNGGDHG